MTPRRPFGTTWLEGLDSTPGDESAADLLRRVRWEATSLGAFSTWELSLRSHVALIMKSRFPMRICWGPDLVQIYNDAFIPILGVGQKHPRAYGEPLRVTWPDLYDVIAPMMEAVVHDDRATWSEDQLFLLNRVGFVEDAYFTFSYSPLADDSGKPRGVLSTAIETTARVVEARRMATIAAISSVAGSARSRAQAAIELEGALRDRPDLPFALVYEVRGATFELVARSGLPPDTLASPRSVAVDETHVWPLAAVARDGRPRTVEDVRATLDAIAMPRDGEEIPRLARLVPLGGDAWRGVLVAGLSPRRRVDDDYEAFVSLVGVQIGHVLAAARSHEEERARADAFVALSNARSAFFSNISHELRTPLTLMLGPLESLLSETRAPSSDRRMWCELAYRNATRLHELVNGLLDFARLEAGRVRGVFAPVDIAAVVQDVASGFRSTIEAADLFFSISAPPVSEPIFVDEALLERVLLNLLSNAFKFTLEGSIRVRVRERPDSVSIDVEDTGCGIPRAEIPLLFRRFHRVVGAVGRSIEGTGLGLATVRDLVALHGGSVEVESEVGRGTVFRVKIPKGQSHLAAEDIVEKTGPGARRKRAVSLVPSGGTRRPPTPAPAPEEPLGRVLVVDDNADLRDYMESLLETSFVVSTASDGVEALEQIARARPDIVVADVMMPRMDGVALVRAVRNDPALATLPIVLISARAGEDARVDGLQAGADDYICKPFAAAELRTRVATHVRLARTRDEATERLRATNVKLGRALEETATARARSEFLGLLSHELRTPLNAVIGSASLLQVEATTPSQVELVATIEDAGNELLRKIDRILEYTQRRSTQTMRAPRRFVLAPLLDELLAGIRPVASAKHIELERAIAPDVAEAWIGDPERLREVLTLLLDNAIKFTHAGKVTLGAGCVHDQGKGWMLELFVEDSGIGIAEAHTHRLFRPFSPVDASTTRAYQGIGMGLALAAVLVEAMGGTVDVESTLGRGSRFRVSAPAEPAPP